MADSTKAETLINNFQSIEATVTLPIDEWALIAVGLNQHIINPDTPSDVRTRLQASADIIQEASVQAGVEYASKTLGFQLEDVEEATQLVGQIK